MFSIVIPVYNESENIENLINEILISLKQYPEYEIIIIDDFSNDGTINKIKRLNKIKNIKLICNDKNYGQSFSIHRGILESNYNTIVTIDGDGQNNPNDIPKLIERFNSDENLLLLGGIRKKRKDNIVKIISSRLANLVRSRILDDDCKDTGCSLKIFEKNVFTEIPYFDGIHRFLPALFKGFGYKTQFVNVDHRKRKYGYSKYGTINRLYKGIIDIYKVKKIIKNKNI